MSKFKKVSENNQIPNFIEKKFVGASYQVEEDPYAELRNNSAENRIKISKNEIGLRKEATSVAKSWEKVQGASIYEDLRAQSMEERLANLEFGSIKRSDYGIEENSVRTTTSNLQAFSQDDYLDAMLRKSASIFNPDMIQITEEFMNSQETTSEQSRFEQQQKREAKASRHSQWENKKMNSIREDKVVSTRAHSILRTSADVSNNSQFGMIDTSVLDEREQIRIANQEAIRNKKSAVKAHKQEAMSENSKLSAQTARDIYNFVSLDFDDLD
jgi:hypothetical protein